MIKKKAQSKEDRYDLPIQMGMTVFLFVDGAEAQVTAHMTRYTIPTIKEVKLVFDQCIEKAKAHGKVTVLSPRKEQTRYILEITGTRFAETGPKQWNHTELGAEPDSGGEA